MFHAPIPKPTGVPLSSSQQLRKGMRLFHQRYVLLGKLGEGGMGVVWLAQDTTEDTPCVLKFLPALLLRQEREMQRLRAEVEAGKKLRHPRLLATYGLAKEGPLAAIVMEYAPGGSLKNALEKHPPGFYEPADIQKWCEDALDALRYLHHEARRVHRDLKPANVLLDKNGRALLADFGISQRLKESLSRHSLAGAQATQPHEGEVTGATLAYASPQQLAGQPAHPADDIYSFGALVYELLTGAPPFFRGGPAAIFHQIKSVPPTPLHARRAELVAEKLVASPGLAIPDRWESLVQSCLAKDRAARPAAIDDVIRRWRTPSAAVAPSAPPRAAQPSNSSMDWKTAIALIIVAVVLMLPGLSLFLNSADHSSASSTVLKKFMPPQVAGRFGPVASVAFSPDGRTLASGIGDEMSQDNRVILWDTTTGQPRSTLTGYSGYVCSVAFSPDGRTLATGNADNTVILWNTATGKPKSTLKGHSEVVIFVTFSADGYTLVSKSGGGTLIFWDATTGQSKSTLKGHFDSVNLSPDGRTLATGSVDNTVILWDTATAQPRSTLRGHSKDVNSVAFSPDGRTLASASKDGTVILWDTTTGQIRSTLIGHSDPARSVAFSPDGRTLVSASWDGLMILWDTTTGQIRSTLTGRPSPVDSVSFSPDGRFLVSTSWVGPVILWDAVIGKPVTIPNGHSDSVWSVFSPDGRTLASAKRDDTIMIWDAISGKEKARFIGNGKDWITMIPEGYYDGPKDRLNDLICFMPRRPSDPLPTEEEIRQLRAHYHQPAKVREALKP